MKTMVCLWAMLLCIALAMPSYAIAQRMFVDSVGREVIVDEEITRIAVSGPLAQIVVFALAPDKLVGVANEWDDAAKELIAEAYTELPVLGQLYGGKGSMNLEELLAAAPQVVIDVGETKEGVAEDLNALSGQTGIPFVHIAAYTDSMDETYRMLGELLDMQEEADVLATYYTNVYMRMQAIAADVEKVDLLYITGDRGLNVIAKDSYHSEAIDLLANNLAVVDLPSSRGTGNEVDMEQILIWNPDVIVFSDQSIYDTVGDDPLWQHVDAIQNGMYYEVPAGPYNWLGFPPSVQRLLGMMWMASTLYPDAVDYELYEEVATYFDLFYHCKLTRTQFDVLTAHSFAQ